MEMDPIANGIGAASPPAGVPPEFLATWSVAEELAAAPDADERLAGIVLACRWIGGATRKSSITGRPELPRSPVRGVRKMATPELIQEEFTAAVSAAATAKRAEERRFAAGVVAALDWVWNGSSQSPLDLAAGDHSSTKPDSTAR